ncbi:MAG TPA: hypothetical protein DCR14_04995, partial [Acidimicrobiaceae bacterium]|nr:hypothetical protein [Acidimicrobiaceae bacterium]
MTDHPLLRGLDASQREAVASPASPIAVIAAAGSGKTTVLTRRIAYRVATDDAAARHVLALTFTRDAASELRRRLRRLDLRDPVEAGTFHSVALRLLRDRAMAANSAPPRVADDRLRLLREVLTEVRLRAEPTAVMADIDWSRARLVAASDYDRAIRQSRRRGTVPPGRFAEVVAAYEALKRRRGVVDFDDLLHGVLNAFESDGEWAAAVRWRFRHLFVDEAQDLNPLQHRMLEALRGGRADLCLVGDPRQAIYGWNGADPSVLEEVDRHVPGVTVVRLATNHRCSPQVVRAGAAALHAAGQADDSASSRPDAAAVEVMRIADEHREAAEIALRVSTLLRHRSPSDLAVLARTNEQVAAIDAALRAAGVATERAAGRSPLDLVVREAVRTMSREALAVWADEQFDHADPLRRRVAEEADRFLASGEVGGFRAWIDSHSPFDDLDDTGGQAAVAVLTFHAAKGREWWGVFVAGVEEGLVPHASAASPAQMAEEARLLYVAITRASHQLVLSAAAQRNGRASEPSRWLQAVAATAAADAPAPPPTARVP